MSATARTIGRRLLGSRIVHFVAVGGALHAIIPDRGGALTGPSVHVTAEQAERALVAARSALARSLTDAESREVLDGLVTREVLAREAMRLGILPPDEAVTVRLADAMRERLAAAAPQRAPSKRDVDLEAEALAGRGEERVALDVVFVDRRREDALARAERAARLLARDGRAEEVDPSPIAGGATWTEDALTRAVGSAVARAAMTTPVARVSEPIASTWGFFVVRPTSRRRSTSDETRGAATAAVAAREKRAFVDALARRAAQAYEVRVDLPPGEQLGPWRWSAGGSARGASVD